MNFGMALERLKRGCRVARAGWNGRGMWIVLVTAGTDYPPQHAYVVTEPNGALLPRALLPWIGMKTADDCFVPWLASQTDLLAEDWEIVT